MAFYLEGREPQLLRLEGATDYMPSYYANRDGEDLFGASAQNYGENIHSIKPLLVDDVEIPGLGHPSQVAFRMLSETVRRAIEQLRAQRIIPAEVATLDVATNLGCTPRFQLDTRTLLRDVAQRAGLRVSLANLVEEPVAAAYEVMLSGLVSDGRVLIIDMGGGTLDIAVLRVGSGGQSFELYASGGYLHAGDAFTKLIVDRLKGELGVVADAQPLPRVDETLLWQRAETAKQQLSLRSSAIVPLGGVANHGDATVEVTREWFIKASGNLRVLVKHDVATVYRLARLVLDRGDEFDPAPGTVDFYSPRRGIVKRLTEVPFDEDVALHIDHVILVGGATNMPMVEQLFREVFGDRLILPELVGIDRSSIVALGLSRPKPNSMSNLRYPSWGVSVEFATSEGSTECPVYEPYAPSFAISRAGTSTYAYEVQVPQGATDASLVFRPVGGSGTRWPSVALSRDDRAVTFHLNLFGDVRLETQAHGDLLQAMPGERRAPWSPPENDGLAEWLPPWQQDPWWKGLPDYDLRNEM